MNSDDPFISYLYLLTHVDTGTLAALRRACGHRRAESHNCQDFASVSTRPPDFLTATLAAQYSAAQIGAGRHHARYSRRGSIGAAWSRFCRERDRDQDPATFYRKRQEALARGRDAPRPPSIHERFRTLLDAELDIDGTGELAYRLRGLVRMCVAADVPIDVIQLAYDLRGWRAESRYVQERWARAFYAPPRDPADHRMETTESASGDEQDQTADEKENETNAD